MFPHLVLLQWRCCSSANETQQCQYTQQIVRFQVKRNSWSGFQKSFRIPSWFWTFWPKKSWKSFFFVNHFSPRFGASEGFYKCQYVGLNCCDRRRSNESNRTDCCARLNGIPFHNSLIPSIYFHLFPIFGFLHFVPIVMLFLMVSVRFWSFWWVSQCSGGLPIWNSYDLRLTKSCWNSHGESDNIVNYGPEMGRCWAIQNAHILVPAPKKCSKVGLWHFLVTYNQFPIMIISPLYTHKMIWVHTYFLVRWMYWWGYNHEMSTCDTMSFSCF